MFAHIRRIAVILLAGYLLLGGLLLPLSDFSFLNELPRMYHAYEKVVDPHEKGFLDFVGDYLLGGKTLLGHNQHDRPDKSGQIQFQHTAVFAVVIDHFISTVQPLITPAHISYYSCYLPGDLNNYHSSLFRPPLA